MTAEVRVSAEGEGEGSQKGNNRCLVSVTGSLAAREWLLLCNERQGVMSEPHAHPASFHPLVGYQLMARWGKRERSDRTVPSVAACKHRCSGGGQGGLCEVREH